jgi:hypothetical protein
MQTVFQPPRLRTLARHALPHVIEGTVVPVGLFYGALWVIGVWGALASALIWSYAALARRLLLRKRIPGLLIVGALGLTVRTIAAFATGSVFIYFLQPTLGTVAVACAFLLSVPAGRPLAQKLAADFVPLPTAFVSHPVARKMFLRITVLWGFVMLANAGVTIWLLVSESIGAFVLTRAAASLVLTGGATLVSTAWFRRSIRRHGLLRTVAVAA